MLARATVPKDAEIAAVMADPALSAAEKQMAKQKIINARVLQSMLSEDGSDAEDDDGLAHLKCSFCIGICDRPVTPPCQHCCCLKCFRRWTNQGKLQCPTCRADFTKSVIQNPRINTMLAATIRLALQPPSQRNAAASAPIADSSRPDEAYMTENAKRKGLSNAASGRMRVSCPPHHFGPIGPQFDPERGQGIRVGGYQDDRDEGEWFLYTGSGGRDLSGNKRTNKEQAYDQKFESYNKALLRSCERGLPVRVVRSYKEKLSAYAPPDAESALRYDGIYKIVACWRTVGSQGKLVCRYLFRRCDNEPAPWSAGQAGDEPWDVGGLPNEATAEIVDCKETITYAPESPYWAWDDTKRAWGWTRTPPVAVTTTKVEIEVMRKDVQTLHIMSRFPYCNDARCMCMQATRALIKWACELCKGVMTDPVCTPCAHHFCRRCLVTAFDTAACAGASGSSGRTFRARKQPKRCPRCSAELVEFMKGCQANQAMAAEIASARVKLCVAEQRLASKREWLKRVLKSSGSEPDIALGAALEGTYVRVWWPAESQSFTGLIKAHVKGTTYTVVYVHDDDVLDHDLAKEQIEWLTVADDGEPWEDPATQEVAPASQTEVSAPTDEQKHALAREAEANAQEAADAAHVAAKAAQARANELYERFEGVADRDAIDAMIEDQGGDTREVAAMLKRMKRAAAVKVRPDARLGIKRVTA